MQRPFLKAFVLALLVLVLVAPISAQGKSITVTWPQEPDSLNPMYSTMTFAGYTISLYLSSAWELDANLNPVPVLVSEIPSVDNGGISADGTTFTFKLKEGLVWSDGDPLDSADFLFTQEMYTSPSNTPLSISPWDRMSSIEAPDATTVVVTFDAPYAPWLGLFSRILPEHVLRPVFEAEGTLDAAAFNRAPTVSSGPYILEDWDVGNFMRFTVNPNFVGGTANIDTVIVRFITEDAPYVESLIAGDSQIGTFVPFDQVPALEAAGLTVLVLPSGYNEGWFLNAGPGGHPALADVNVRKAIGMAFDRFSVVEDLLLGATYPSSGYWEGTPYDNPDVAAVPFDPAMAGQLLDEAGWVDSNGDGIRDKDGVDLSLRFVTNTRQVRRDIQAIAQQQLGEVGIQVLLENYPSDVFFNGYADGGPAATGQYDIAEWSSSVDAFPDPDTTRFLCSEIPSDASPSGGNWNYYCDPELDALFTAQAAETDYQARIDLFHQIDARINDAYVWLGVWFDADVWVVGSNVLNANLNGVTPFFDIVNWDVE
jgi:peptide/nickel transport system substrate-binding protein